MKKILFNLFVTGLILLMGPHSYGHMGGGGGGGEPVTLYVPADYSSIQSAINASSSGDTIIVSPGTYQEQVTLKAGVTVMAEGTEEERANFTTAQRTIIDGSQGGGGHGSMMKNNTVWGADSATIDGFTITGAAGEPVAEPRSAGNGVLCVKRNRMNPTGVSPIIKNNIIEANTHGIAAPWGASPVIDNNIIRNNEHAGIGILDADSRPVITNNQIYNNGYTGIGCDAGAPTIDGNYIYGNSGAGIGTKNGATPLIINNAIGMDKDGNPSGNTLAGVGCDGSTPTIRNNAIYYNSEAGIGIKNSANVVITDNEIGNNTLAGIGTLAEEPGSHIEVHRNWIHDNAAAGVAANEVTGSITNNIITQNGGAGIAVFVTPLSGIYNNVVAYNYVGITNWTDTAFPIENNAAYMNQMPGIKDDTGGYNYNAVYDNNGAFGGGSWPWVVYPNYGGNWAGPNDVFPLANPQFIDPGNTDFRLQAGSPLIDTGNPDSGFNDVDCTRNDIGVYGGPNPFQLWGAPTPVDPCPVWDPTYSPVAGTYYEAQTITISTTTVGATIKYTTDGTDPKTSATAVEGPAGSSSATVEVGSTMSLQAYGYKTDMADSFVISATYIIQTPPQTIILHPDGGYCDAEMGVAPDADPSCDYWDDEFDTILDSDDGWDSGVYLEAIWSWAVGTPGLAWFELTMDDPVGLEGATIESITVKAIVYAYDSVVGWDDFTLVYSMDGSVFVEDPWNPWEAWDIVYGDPPYPGASYGSWTPIQGNWYELTIPLETTDPDGGPLDLTDLNNLRILGVASTDWGGEGYPMTVYFGVNITEVYVEIEYTQ